MSDPSLHTTQLHGWLARMRAGDLSAREELLRNVCGRLERLARKMLQRRSGSIHQPIQPQISRAVSHENSFLGFAGGDKNLLALLAACRSGAQKLLLGSREAIARGAIGFDAVKHLVLCRIDRRPPRLDLTVYPYLPRASVALTSAKAYLHLLTGASP